MGPRSRAACAGGALLAFAAAAATVPGEVRSHVAPTRAPAHVVVRDAYRGVRLAALRDPFVPALPEPEPVPSAPVRAIVPVPPTPAPVLQVIAVVTGPHPAALIEAGGVTLALVPGDRIAGRRIAAVDAGGIRFADGTRLGLIP